MVIACGGDGTINEVVNGLAGSQVPMALLPAGTANILAKELGIPWDIPHAARLIPGGDVRRIALGIAYPTERQLTRTPCRATGRYFLCVAGAGPDGAIVNGVHEGLKKNAGVLAYWAEGVRQLFSYSFPEMRVRSGGQERKRPSSIVGRTAQLRRPIQNHHRREPVRRFVRVSHQFDDAAASAISFACPRSGWASSAKWTESKPGKRRKRSASPPAAIPCSRRWMASRSDSCPIAFRIVPDALSIIEPPAALSSKFL